MKWIILNQVPHLQHYVFHYLKQVPNYKIFHYRVSEDFEFFKPDRAVLITNQMNAKVQRFINEAKEENVFLTIITENEELEGYNYLVREKDNFLNTNENPTNYNYSNMHLCMPKIIRWIKNRKSGSFKFFNREKRNQVEEGWNNYIEPSQGVDITEEILDLDQRKKVNIYTPTYYRFEKTKSSILDLIKLAKKSIHDVKIYVGDNNTKIPEMREWLEELNQKEDLIEVYFNPENQGKGMVVNYMDRNIARKDYDYFFSIDSDMRIEKEEDNVFDRMIEILETCTNVGLVASNQAELCEHWYGKTVSVEKDRGFNVGVTSTGVGIAGGCVCLRKRDWDTIGGYKENHDVYTGDDSILTYNVYRKLGMRPVIAHDYFLKHPKCGEDETEYTNWKRESWQRDNFNFIKDNYTGTNRKGFYD